MSMRNPVSFSGIWFSQIFTKSTDYSLSFRGLESRIVIGESVISVILLLEYSFRFIALLLVGLFGFFGYFLDKAVAIPVLVVILNSIFLGTFGGKTSMSDSFETLALLLNLLPLS